MKNRIIDLLDKGAIEEAKDPIIEYWEKKGTYFETKMEPWKFKRANWLEWRKPILLFKITRHPGGLRRQTWMYDFEEDRAYLESEGSIPLAKPYKADKDARAIVDAIVYGHEHPSVLKKGRIVHC
ncbi:MAG: hypothetical protein QW193_05545 [Nitrososphaerales archaeon]